MLYLWFYIDIYIFYIDNSFYSIPLRWKLRIETKMDVPPEDPDEPSTSTGRRHTLPPLYINNNNNAPPISWHQRSANSPPPSPLISYNSNNDHDYTNNHPNNFNGDGGDGNGGGGGGGDDDDGENTPPTPLDPNIFREHAYSLLSRPPTRQFGAVEESFYRHNFENPPILRPEIVDRYTRQVSMFAFKYSCLDVNYIIHNEEFLNSFGDYQNDIFQLYDLVFDEIKHQYQFTQRFKLNLGVHAIFTNPNYDTGENPIERREPLDPEVSFFIWLPAREFDAGTDIPIAIDEMLSQIVERISTSEKGPSGLCYKHILSVSFAFNLFTHQFGAHSDNFFNLPPCFNMKSLIPPRKRPRVSSCFINAVKDYHLFHELSLNNVNFDGIKEKTSFFDIAKFEGKNPRIQIHVLVAEFQNEGEELLDHFSVTYKSKNTYTRSSVQITLFLYKEHFYCVENVGKFIHQCGKKKNSRSAPYFCFNCLSSFADSPRLKKHLDICDSKKSVIPSFPKKTLEFGDYSATISAPYVIYYDLETDHSPVRRDMRLGPSTVIENELKPIKIAYKIVFSEDDIFIPHPSLKRFEEIKIFSG